ncbi:unnamed protein product [Arctogadus glacialis]
MTRRAPGWFNDKRPATHSKLLSIFEMPKVLVWFSDGSGSYLPAARVTRFSQNIPKCLQVGTDHRGDLERCIKPGSEPSGRLVGLRGTPEGCSDPHSARSPPGTGVAAPSGPSGEPPPTAVRHFTLCLSALRSEKSVGGTLNQHST